MQTALPRAYCFPPSSKSSLLLASVCMHNDETGYVLFHPVLSLSAKGGISIVFLLEDVLRQGDTAPGLHLHDLAAKGKAESWNKLLICWGVGKGKPQALRSLDKDPKAQKEQYDALPGDLPSLKVCLANACADGELRRWANSLKASAVIPAIMPVAPVRAVCGLVDAHAHLASVKQAPGTSAAQAGPSSAALAGAQLPTQPSHSSATLPAQLTSGHSPTPSAQQPGGPPGSHAPRRCVLLQPCHKLELGASYCLEVTDPIVQNKVIGSRQLVIVSVKGEGGFAVAYVCRELTATGAVTGLPLVLKVWKDAGSWNLSSLETVAQQEREDANAAGQEAKVMEIVQRCPNIVTYRAFGFLPRQSVFRWSDEPSAAPSSRQVRVPCILMEHCSYSAYGFIKETGPMDATSAAALLRDVAAGLHYMHNMRSTNFKGGIIHRDITDSNVLRRPDGTWVLSDLGMKKALTTATGNNFTNFIGLPNIMPEEVLLQQGYDVTVDVWQLGCLGVFIMTGKRMWDSVADSDRRLECMRNMPAAMAQLYPGLPPSGRDFVLYCLQPKGQRPSMEQVVKHPFLTGARRQ